MGEIPIFGIPWVLKSLASLVPGVDISYFSSRFLKLALGLPSAALPSGLRRQSRRKEAFLEGKGHSRGINAHKKMNQ